MGCIRSSRFIRGRSCIYSPVSAAPKRFTQKLELVSRIPVLTFVDEKTFVITSGHDLEPTGVVQILGSKEGIHDGVYAIDSVLSNPDISQLVTVKKGGFQPDNLGSSEILLAQTVIVQHNLNTLAPQVTLIKSSDGCVYDIAIQHINSNTMALIPHTPVAGEFVVIVRE